MGLERESNFTIEWVIDSTFTLAAGNTSITHECCNEARERESYCAEQGIPTCRQYQNHGKGNVQAWKGVLKENSLQHRYCLQGDVSEKCSVGDQGRCLIFYRKAQFGDDPWVGQCLQVVGTWTLNDLISKCTILGQHVYAHIEFGFVLQLRDLFSRSV